MAIRNIRTIGDSILTKKAKVITDSDRKLKILVNDMLDTMYDAEGVGLAAPQVGILKRLVVIDVSPEGNTPYVLINPTIINQEGEQVGGEACLSVPGKTGIVRRPNYVKVSALNENMEPYVLEGTELLARAICHELEHLDGILYVSRVEGDLIDVSSEDEDEEE